MDIISAIYIALSLGRCVAAPHTAFHHILKIKIFVLGLRPQWHHKGKLIAEACALGQRPCRDCKLFLFGLVELGSAWLGLTRLRLSLYRPGFAGLPGLGLAYCLGCGAL